MRRSGEVQQGLCDDGEDDTAGQKLMPDTSHYLNIVDVLDVNYYQHQYSILISSSRAVDPPMRPCGVVVLLKPSVTPNNLYIDHLHF